MWSSLLARQASTTIICFVMSPSPCSMCERIHKYNTLQIHSLNLKHRVTNTPRYGNVYDSLAKCQTACVTKVTECNAVNYAPTNVPGRCVQCVGNRTFVVVVTLKRGNGPFVRTKYNMKTQLHYIAPHFLFCHTDKALRLKRTS